MTKKKGGERKDTERFRQHFEKTKPGSEVLQSRLRQASKAGRTKTLEGKNKKLYKASQG